MTTASITPSTRGGLTPFPQALPQGIRLYAIAFDLHIESLRKHYSATSPNNAYAEIREMLEEDGFAWRQGSVYFGDPARVNAITCVLVAQRLARVLPWFAACVRDIRMLRIEENNDLGPAIEAVDNARL